MVREIRHKGTSIMVASQDPPSVPTSLIELSTQIILHKFNSPAWLKHVQKADTALDALTPARLRLPRTGRGLRLEQQGHGRCVHPRDGEGPLPPSYHEARGRNEDGGRFFGWVDLTPDQFTLHPAVRPKHPGQ